MRTEDTETVGPYRLAGPLGQGGMGEVYRAYDPRLDRVVAVKRIRPVSAERETTARERLRREARAVARIHHPSIVPVFDIVEDEDQDWVVMELVEGETLAHRLRSGPLPVDAAIALGIEVADGLDAAHRADVVHRDLKSENVMIGRDGRARVLDFGLAKRLDPGEDGLSATEAVLGTCRSMSPEQARSREVDARSDLFSLGVLLYEALTGVSPFRGDTPWDTLSRVVTHQQEPVAELRPEVPAELSTLVDSLLEKDPALRTPSAGEVAGKLRRLQNAPSASAPLAADHPPTLEARPPRARRRPPLRPRWRPRRRPALALVPIAVLLAVGAAWWRARQPDLLYVAVAEPAIERGAELDGVPLIADGLRAALLGDLLSRHRISVLAPEEVDRLEGSPVEVGRDLAADVVLATTLGCGPRICTVELSRIAAADGSLQWSRRFEAPAEELDLAAGLAASHLAEAFPRHRPRGDRQLPPPGAFAEYLELRREYYENPPDSPDADLVARIRALRSRAPDFVEPYLLEAKLARRRYYESRELGELEEAIALGRRAREIEPGSVEPLVNLFRTALDGNRLDLAQECLADLERLEPGSAKTLGLRARLLERRGEIDAALDLYRNVIEGRPSVASLYALANMEVRAGLPAEARATLERLLHRSPHHLGARSTLARLELLSGSPERAAELYRELSERRPRYAFASNQGVAELLLGDVAAAAASFEAAVAMAPGNPAALLNLADARLLAADTEAARETYRSVIELTHAPGASEVDWQNLTIRGQAHAHLGDRTAAVAAAQEALRLAPQNPQAAYEAALVYVLVGDLTSALVNVERARELGVEARWFSFPWFAPLAGDPRFRALVGFPG